MTWAARKTNVTQVIFSVWWSDQLTNVIWLSVHESGKSESKVTFLLILVSSMSRRSKKLLTKYNIKNLICSEGESDTFIWDGLCTELVYNCSNTISDQFTNF